ncbi:MAG: DUF664 domain-containing protein [Hyphomicrobiales bacterium]
MSVDPRASFQPLPGFRSSEAGSFLVQLDDQLAILTKDTRDLAPADLAWQPAPGMNTIGMLLAHLAVVEVWWTKLALGGETDADVRDVLGIGVDDDGLPLPAGAPPYPLLDGKDLAFYDDLLARARAFLTRAAKDVPPGDLERVVTRPRPDGTTAELNVRWYFYHLLEHFAGHRGQIQLLRHLRRVGSARP